MAVIDNDKDVVEKGRQNILKDDEESGLVVKVPLRDKILSELVQKLEEKEIGQKISSVWTGANADRVEWLERQQRYLRFFDEFIEPIYTPSTDWSSNLHLPVVLTVCKTFHARMYTALMSIDPPFTVMSRTGANTDRSKLIQDLMRYTLRDWANENTGVSEVVDAWLWDWVTTGDAILKGRWEKKFTRFKDVEEVPTVLADIQIDKETGMLIPTTKTRIDEKEVTKTIVTFDGPTVEKVNIEDIVIVGGGGDPQKADYVIEQCMVTASDLWTLADRGIFRKEIVEEIISDSGPDGEGADINGSLKQQRAENNGNTDVDKSYDIDRYKILEAYLKVDTDGSGIASEIIVWIHAKTRKILRATYLYRVMKTGLRPYFKISFHKRHGQEHSVGLVELLYSLAKEIDAIHNMKIDIGILTSIPWGFYRPAPSMPEEKLEVTPGSFIPVDNPSSDVFIPNLGNRTAFGFQEEASLQNQIDRLTSISELNLGLLSAQGAARTATGARAILGESNANLDIFIQRMNRGWKRALVYLFHMAQQNMPAGLQFRVLGDDGNSYWQRIENREELKGMYDFELEPNSVNSNKQVQIEVSDIVLQMTGNPLDLQLGLVSTRNRYEALKNSMAQRGIKDFSRFLTKPANVPVVFTPEEVCNRILHGIDTALDPSQDLAGIIAYVQHILSDDQLLGQFNQQQVITLVTKMQEASGLQQAMEQAAAQQANRMQQQVNTQMGTTGQETMPVGTAESQPQPQGQPSE